MRCCEEGQLRFAEAERRDDHDWMEEAAIMQREALQATGFPATSRNIALLRSAALRHPEEALYVRHNLNRDGELREGDEAPQMVLQTLSMEPVEWPPRGLDVGTPLVVASGSVS